MPHPQLENNTPFNAEVLHLVDEEFVPLLTLAIKATFDIGPRGSLALSADQVPLNVAGEFTDPEADGESSYRFEPEVAPLKLATDVVLLGHAHAPNSRTSQMDVGLRVGPLSKGARVFGDRVWFRAMGSVNMTKPQSFHAIPMIYERAFGGWDRRDHDATRHGYEPRNPVGRGFHNKRGMFRDGSHVANIEDPRYPIAAHTDCPPPAGFGFISPNWQPRAKLAGTYDEAWDRTRKPLLPGDFDRRHFNAASPGLVAHGYLRGDEPVQTMGLSPEGRLGFQLPGLPPPTTRVVLPKGNDQSPAARLDTVIIDLDHRQLMMIWRTCMTVDDGPHGIVSIGLECPEAASFPKSDVVKSTTPAANQAHGPRVTV